MVYRAARSRYGTRRTTGPTCPGCACSRSDCGPGSRPGTATRHHRLAEHQRPAPRGPERHRAGLAVFWTGGIHGLRAHRAQSLGSGKIRSTDAGGSGRVATVDLGWIERNWHLTYAGWAWDINEVTIPHRNGQRTKAADGHSERQLTATVIKNEPVADRTGLRAERSWVWLLAFGASTLSRREQARLDHGDHRGDPGDRDPDGGDSRTTSCPIQPPAEPPAGVVDRMGSMPPRSLSQDPSSTRTSNRSRAWSGSLPAGSG